MGNRIAKPLPVCSRYRGLCIVMLILVLVLESQALVLVLVVYLVLVLTLAVRPCQVFLFKFLK